MKKILFYFIGFLGFTVTNLSAQKATIQGRIIDANTKEGIPSVNVIYNNTAVNSDIDGNYKFQVDPGTYNLSYRFLGYDSLTKSVTLVADEIKTLNVSLVEMSKLLGQVVVTGSKYDQKIEEVTMSIDIIRPNLTQDKAATNIQTAINQSPGVQIVDGEPQIRGGSGYNFGAGSRVMILVDDIPVLSGDAGRPSWSFLPMENLEQIEVLKGAASVLYGSSALSGVINIRTAYPTDKPLTKINLNTGIYDNPRSSSAKYWNAGGNPTYTNLNFFHSQKFGNLDLVVGGNLFSDEGYIGPEPDKISVKKISGNRIAINGVGILNQDTLSGALADTTYYSNSTKPRNFEKRARMNVNLRYRSKSIEGLTFGVNSNAMVKTEVSSLMMLDADSGIYKNYPGTQSYGRNNNWYVDPFITYAKRDRKQTLRGRWYHNDLNNNNNQSNLSDWFFGEYQYYQKIKVIDLNFTAGLMSSFTKSTSQLFAGNESGDGLSTAMNNAVYVQLDKKFFDRLSVSGGGRVERFKINDNEIVKPVFRAGANLRVLKATYARASWGQGFRFPTIAEKYIATQVGPVRIFPNYDLKPEESWNMELGVKQGFKIGNFKGFIDVAGFRQQVKDAIEFNFGLFGAPPITVSNVSQKLGFKSINIKESRIQGYETSIAGMGKIGKLDIGVLAGYTYIEPFNLDPSAYIDTSNNQKISYKSASVDTSGILKYRFEHMFKGDIQFSYEKWTVGLSYRYLSFMKNYDVVFNVLDTTNLLPTGIVDYRQKHLNEGIVVVDLRLIYEVNSNFKISLLSDNLFNKEYMLRPLLVERPRTFALQFSFKF